MTRPWAPLPAISPITKGCSATNLRARGERCPPAVAGAWDAEAAAGAAAGVTAFGVSAAAAIGASAEAALYPETSVPAGPTRQIAVRTGTRSPSEPSSASTSPEAVASISMEVLSVSASAMMSPLLTVSPTLMRHAPRMHSSTEFPALGIRIASTPTGSSAGVAVGAAATGSASGTGIASGAGAAAGAPDGARDDASSPAVPTAQIAVSTGTRSPSAAKSARTLPPSVASTSIEVLSVSASAMMSPFLIVSPTLMRHLLRTHSSTELPAFGITIATAMLRFS